MILYQIKKKMQTIKTYLKWRKKNKHNSTILINPASFNFVSVGIGTYGKLNVHCSNSTNELLIGCYCSIADDVVFLLSSEHSLTNLSTYPFKNRIIDYCSEGLSKGNIVVGDDVWIGSRATILSGIKIGQGSVIGASAVVTKDVPPYSIVCGNPAHIVKFRFNDQIINFLLTLDYKKINREMIKKHSEQLYTDISCMDLNEIKKLFEWFPKV